MPLSDLWYVIRNSYCSIKQHKWAETLEISNSVSVVNSLYIFFTQFVEILPLFVAL